MSAEGNLPPARQGSRGGFAIAALIVCFVVAAAGFTGGWLLGGRRLVTQVQAPASNGVAYILEARCAMGRCQSLWVGPDVSDAKRVETLAGDTEQAGEIAWTPDGSRVAFIVNGYQLRLFDARTGANLGATTVIEPEGSPPSRVIRGVTFSTNGAAITFDNCPRDHSGCKPGILAIAR